MFGAYVPPRKIDLNALRATCGLNPVAALPQLLFGILEIGCESEESIGRFKVCMYFHGVFWCGLRQVALFIVAECGTYCAYSHLLRPFSLADRVARVERSEHDTRRAVFCNMQ